MQGRWCDTLSRNLITGIAACCARTASGHAAAAPPRSDMNSRRFTANASRASDVKDSTVGAAALRDFDPAYVGFGSFTSDRHARDHARCPLHLQERTNIGIAAKRREVPKGDIL
jgi:hypothetical protein